MFMNRPTARLIAVVTMAAEQAGDGIDSEDVLLMLGAALTGVHYGRERMWKALEWIAPEVARFLRQHDVDIRHVYAFDRRQIRAVERELRRAAAWLDEHGPQYVPLSLMDEALAADWPSRGWRLEVWRTVNDIRAGFTGGNMLPLPRDTRHALSEVGLDL